jgi:tetratricopeptide (TPR) repeat protein
MNWVERIARWVGLDVGQDARPELINLRGTMEIIRATKRSEDYVEALASLDRAVEIARELGDTTVPLLLELNRADIYIRQRDYEAAEDLLNRMIQASPAGTSFQRAYAMVFLGVIAYRQGDLQVARERLERAQTESIASNTVGAEARAQCHLAEIFLDEGNASYATHSLKDGMEKLYRSGDHELATYLTGRMGEALIANGDTAEGDILLTRALRQAQQFRERAEQRRLHGILAARAQTLGRYTDSYNQLEKALALMPENAPERAQTLLRASNACLYLDKTADALVYAEQAYQLRPHDVMMLGGLGVALHAAGRAQDALPHLEAAVSDESPAWEVRRVLAAAYLDCGQPDKATETYQAAYQAAQTAHNLEELARIQRDLGLMHLRSTHPAEAIKAWTTAIGHYEAINAYDQVARLYCDIANARLTMGQAARAMKDFDEALMLVSRADDVATRGVVLSNAAAIYLEKGDIETSEAFFTESIQIAQKLHDSSAEATRQGNFGWFQWVTGKAARAQSALSYAIQLSEREGLTLQTAVQNSNLAHVVAELGNNEEASRLHLRALSLLKPNDPARWQAILRVNAALHALRTGQTDLALTWITDAAGYVPLVVDAEAHYRVQIAAALAERDTDPTDGLAQLLSLLPAIRTVGLKRLTAEALAALSQLSAATGQSGAGNYWEDARKLYKLIGHPLGQITPAWILAA